LLHWFEELERIEDQLLPGCSRRLKLERILIGAWKRRRVELIEPWLELMNWIGQDAEEKNQMERESERGKRERKSGRWLEKRRGGPEALKSQRSGFPTQNQLRVSTFQLFTHFQER